jgi:hypothetical protein
MDTIHTVLEQMRSDLELAGYAERTRATYLHAAKDLAVFHARSPETMGHAELRMWVAQLAGRGLSAQRRRQHHAALRFLFGRTLGLSEQIDQYRFPRMDKRTAPLRSPRCAGSVLTARGARASGPSLARRVAAPRSTANTCPPTSSRRARELQARLRRTAARPGRWVGPRRPA